MMSSGKKVAWSTLGVVAAVVGFGGFLAVPTAHGYADCTVPGAQLDLHHSSGYELTVDASGASLGPGALVRSNGSSSQASATGGIKGRSVDFRIAWQGTKAYVRFTGTVGDDGVAHGTSSGIAQPIELAAGPWDSGTRFTC
jgi:hypothetical protein